MFFKFVFYDSMIKILTRLVLKQFFALLQEKTKKYCTGWNRHNFRIVSRQIIDRLVLEIFYRNKYDDFELLLPSPLVTIDFTNLSQYGNNTIWISYLTKKASKLLKKMEQYDCSNIVPGLYYPKSNNTDDFLFSTVLTTMTCDQNMSYREEFILCYDKKYKILNKHHTLDIRNNEDYHKTEHNNSDILESIREELKIEASKISASNISDPTKLSNELETSKMTEITNFSSGYNIINSIDRIDLLNSISDITENNTKK